MKESIKDIYKAETEENLQLLENSIIALEENPDDGETINTLFRSAHSIKGGAGLAGFAEIKTFAHLLEDLLEEVRQKRIEIGESLISMLFDAVDILKSMHSNIKKGLPENRGIESKELEKNIRLLLNKTHDNTKESKKDSIQERAVETFYFISLDFQRDIYFRGLDPLMFLDDLNNAGTVLYLYGDISAIPEIKNYDPRNSYLRWALFLKGSVTVKDLTDIFCFVIDESNIQITDLKESINNEEKLAEYTINNKTIHDFLDIASESQEAFSDDKHKSDGQDTANVPEDVKSYIRVQTDKLEQLLNTANELMVYQSRLNMLVQSNEETIPDSFLTISDSLFTVSMQLQEQMMRLRMVRIGPTFMQFKRFVRDLSKEMNKEVKLEIEGQDIELDKNMIEKLNEPLKHIIRNCMDHGLESKEERKAKGKDPQGQLSIKAFLESGKVNIEIKDDGKGIEKSRIRNKAFEMGLIEENLILSDSEIYNLIFHPGLSTAAKVTDISGRGVGMDVVKTNISELNGNIDVESKEGEGTTFRLYLPLTLAILDGMQVSIGDDNYIIPTLSILEIFRPENNMLKTISHKGEVVFYRGEYIPILRLHNIFQLENYINEPERAELLVVNSAGLKAALLVDTVVDQFQVVIKSLNKNYRKIKYISSATILGNGNVALILDIHELMQLVRRG